MKNKKINGINNKWKEYARQQKASDREDSVMLTR